MEKNGKIYCDYRNCRLEIKRYDKHVRLPRPQTDRQNQPFAHFHDGGSGQCWRKTVAEAEERKKAATPQDMSAFEKFMTNRDAKSASAKQGGDLHLPA